MGNLDLSSLESMLSGDNLIGISEKLGIGTDEIGSVIKGALPELLTGMQKNASTEEGVASLEKALSDHSAVDISDISSFLGSADQDDGAKIIGHLLGKENVESAERSISEKSGLSIGNVGSILASVAPFLMSLLGKETSGSTSSGSQSGGSGIGSLLGGLLGGSGGGVDLGDLAGAASGLFGSDDTSSSKKKKKKKKEGGLLNSFLNLFK